ncbi:MAG: DUF2200 domain-containing protein [Thermoplasmatota archaeon]
MSRIFDMSFASVYPYYVEKALKKDKTKAQVDELIAWLTGYDAAGLQACLDDERTFREFFAKAPQMNPNCHLIKGVVCGHRVEDIEDPLMQQIRWLDKLIDELARGKKFENIKRA